VDHDQADDSVPPPGTATVRPLRHVRAVRERHLQRFTDAAEAAASRSARAWSWALGETDLAPVTDQQTATPPDRIAIDLEIAIADDRRLRGDRENRADATATILRWLIGDDDRVPIHCDNPGELVGGFGDIVRSREQIAKLLKITSEKQRRAAALSQGVSIPPTHRQRAGQDADYLSGVAGTLSWVVGEAGAPITCRKSEATTRDLKTERLRAEDLIDQATSPWQADDVPSPRYGEGVKSAIVWLLGDATVIPVGEAQSDADSQQ
jgi:hypothetical protein